MFPHSAVSGDFLSVVLVMIFFSLALKLCLGTSWGLSYELFCVFIKIIYFVFQNSSLETPYIES